MAIAREIGHSARNGGYTIADDEMAVGSTLGAPTVCMQIKGTGAIDRIYDIEDGITVFGSLVLHHWDEQTGMQLSPVEPGSFTLYPEHQERAFRLPNRVAVREDIFVLSGQPGDDGSVDPPAVYYTVELHNTGGATAHVGTYAFCQLRGSTPHDLAATFNKRLGALVAWNQSNPDLVRMFGCSEKPTSYETTLDYARAVGTHGPGLLSGSTECSPGDNLGVLHLSHAIKSGERVSFYYLLTFSNQGHGAAAAIYRSCPNAEEALARTIAYYDEVLGRSVVLTPDPAVNRGVLWAKANMLRVQCKPRTGWCFVNDPMRSNNSVGRDTAWFSYGADYLTPAFARASLLAYVHNQERSGMIVEYYDIRTGKTEDYGLNINDNTPLLILALWHHYTATGDDDFLREIYPHAVKAARYILSQRNDQGLVWCTATGASDWGIVGWRNVIKDYRLSGATTEVNAECVAALKTVAHMARVLERHEESATFAAEAEALKTAINTHLYNPNNGLYYLSLDLDGTPRSDVTSDLVFPVIFDVATDETAARIVSRLSSNDFWTEGGIRTTPRDAPNYSPGPEPAYGLMGGVWVGVTFWYAFAVARFSPSHMAQALGMSFHNYSRNPRQNNTVPGQFSEWLHGETLVNEGMMLSPWFPPRYLWAAIEGAGGLDFSTGKPRIYPHLAPEWKWLGVQNLPYRGETLTWLAVRAPDLRIFTNHHFQESASYVAYDEDISTQIQAVGDSAVAMGLRQGDNLLLFAGNTLDQTIVTTLRVEAAVSGAYHLRIYDSLLGHWNDEDQVPADQLRQGIVLQLERKGFWVIEVTQEA